MMFEHAVLIANTCAIDWLFFKENNDDEAKFDIGAANAANDGAMAAAVGRHR